MLVEMVYGLPLEEDEEVEEEEVVGQTEKSRHGERPQLASAAGSARSLVVVAAAAVVPLARSMALALLLVEQDDFGLSSGASEGSTTSAPLLVLHPMALGSTRGTQNARIAQEDPKKAAKKDKKARSESVWDHSVSRSVRGVCRWFEGE